MAVTEGSSKAAVQVDATELFALQESFKAAGKEAQKAARTITNQIGKAMAGELKGAGLVGQGALAAHVARQGVKYERRQVFQGRDGVIRASKFTGGYLPTVVIGLDKELPVSRAGTPNNPKPSAAQVWAGAEFGTTAPFLPKGGKRFRDRRKKGYWFFPTWDRIKDHYLKQWQDAMGPVLDEFKLSRPGGFGG